MNTEFHPVFKGVLYWLAVLMLCGSLVSPAGAVSLIMHDKYEKKVAACNKALLDLYDAAEALSRKADSLVKYGEKGLENAKSHNLNGFKFNQNDSKIWRDQKDVLKKSIKNYQKKCKGITAILKGGVKIK